MVASRGGQWKPDLLGVSSWLTPFFLEMILVLPQPIFALAFYLAVGPLQDGCAGSPGQQDLLEGRKTSNDWQLGEILQVSSVTFLKYYLIKPLKIIK